MPENVESMLSPYRALDLTDEKGLMCGKILGDLGADVIKVERPGGDLARSVGPFYHDEPDPEKSLFWFAFNTNKRGITLDIETADGQEIFKRLVKTADFVIESYAPEYMAKLGLGYSELEKINPGVIVVSITPFGQAGPYKDWKTADIVAWAMGGNMAPWGEADRPPIRISHLPQSYLNAGNDGAAGALTALYYRWANGGKGQQIDVSIQEAIVQSTEHITATWDMRKVFTHRNAPARMGNHVARQIWPCKDGFVSWTHGGKNVLNPSYPLIVWMKEEGYTNDYIDKFNWDRDDFGAISQAEMDQIEEPTGRFFMAHTKFELLEGAVAHEALLYPVFTNADMLSDPQLTARKFWVAIEHPELNTTLTYPGSWVNSSEAPPKVTRRAPLIGEHNEEIYGKELGISKEKLVVLKEAGVI